MGIELNVSYLRAATAGVVTAVCTPVRRGRTLATFLVEVSDERGRPTATARLTCLVEGDAAEGAQASRRRGPTGGAPAPARERPPAGTAAAAAPARAASCARQAASDRARVSRGTIRRVVSGAKPMRAKNRWRSASWPPTAATTWAAPASSA